jgi:hypothetical protein
VRRTEKSFGGISPLLSLDSMMARVLCALASARMMYRSSVRWKMEYASTLAPRRRGGVPRQNGDGVGRIL